MTFTPCLARVPRTGDPEAITLGHPLVDDYLAFVGSRARPNTWLAVAFDLKVFFSVVGREPAEVTPADVLAFLRAQRAPRAGANVVRLGDGEAGLSARTIARRLSSLSGLFAYLVVRGDTGVLVNPVPRGLGARRPGARPGAGAVEDLVQAGVRISGTPAPRGRQHRRAGLGAGARPAASRPRPRPGGRTSGPGRGRPSAMVGRLPGAEHRPARAARRGDGTGRGPRRAPGAHLRPVGLRGGDRPRPYRGGPGRVGPRPGLGRVGLRGLLGDPVADEIWRALRDEPAGLTRTEIRDLFGRNRRGRDIDAALGSLSAAGRIDRASRQDRGRPAELWRARS